MMRIRRSEFTSLELWNSAKLFHTTLAFPVSSIRTLYERKSTKIWHAESLARETNEIMMEHVVVVTLTEMLPSDLLTFCYELLLCPLQALHILYKPG